MKYTYQISEYDLQLLKSNVSLGVDVGDIDGDAEGTIFPCSQDNDFIQKSHTLHCEGQLSIPHLIAPLSMYSLALSHTPVSIISPSHATEYDSHFDKSKGGLVGVDVGVDVGVFVGDMVGVLDGASDG